MKLPPPASIVGQRKSNDDERELQEYMREKFAELDAHHHRADVVHPFGPEKLNA
jgi:hypothetical protein